MRPEDLEIIQLYYQVARQIENRAKSKNNNINFFSGQYGCLIQLDKKGTVTQRELSAILNIRATSLSEVLLKLERKGFIQREPSSRDKRTFLISITPAGHEEIQRAKKQELSRHYELIAPLSEQEKRSFFEILQKIKKNYQELGE